MADPKERIKVLLDSLRARLPFPKRRLPGPSSAPEPFDSLEDGTLALGEDNGPNAAIAAGGGKRKRGATAAERKESLKAFWEALLRSPLALGLLGGFLLLVVALCVVAFSVAAPPRMGTPPASAKGRTGPSSFDGAYAQEGAALTRSLILPRRASTEAQVELERVTRRVYTSADAAPFRSDMDKVDIERLDAAREAAIKALYEAVP